MKKLTCCLCLVLFAFSVGEGKNARENKAVGESYRLLSKSERMMAKTAGGDKVRANKFHGTAKRSGKKAFPNPFRPIINFFKRFFVRKDKTIVCYRPVVHNVLLSKMEIVAKCSESVHSSCSGDKSINVVTDASDREDDALLYTYNITGGEIIGEGAKVVWNLADVQPRIYKISVSVDDGCKFCEPSVTKEIKVVECPDCDPPSDLVLCPTMAVVANQKSVKEGENITFIADVELSGSNPTYNWVISAGEIVSGQGTPMIIVKTKSRTAGKLTASVTLGNIDASCGGGAYDTVDVLKP